MPIFCLSGIVSSDRDLLLSCALDLSGSLWSRSIASTSAAPLIARAQVLKSSMQLRWYAGTLRRHRKKSSLAYCH
jgi:hypothetical protein